jgi:hypothetical protein
MKTSNVLSLFVLTAFLSACSSTPVVNGQKFERDQTLATAGDKAMPEWAELGETQPVRFDHGKVYSVGVTQLRGDERPEAGARIATNNAYANLSKHVENKMEFVLQNSEENTGYDSTSAKFIGSEVSSITGHEFSNEGIWWKRYTQMQEDGSRKIFYRVYSVVTLPENALKAAIHDAINKGKVEHKLSQNFQHQVDRQWSRFVEGEKVQAETRNPSNSENQE